MRRVKRRWALALALALVAGTVGAWAVHNRTGANCASMYDRSKRLDCRAAQGLDALADMADVGRRLDETADPAERDLLLLRLVMDDPRRGKWACERLTDPTMAGWCRDVAGRTHLAR